MAFAVLVLPAFHGGQDDLADSPGIVFGQIRAVLHQSFRHVADMRLGAIHDPPVDESLDGAHDLPVPVCLIHVRNGNIQRRNQGIVPVQFQVRAAGIEQVFELREGMRRTVLIRLPDLVQFHFTDVLLRIGFLKTPGICVQQTLLGGGFHLEITVGKKRNRPDADRRIPAAAFQILLDHEQGRLDLVDALILFLPGGREDIREVLGIQEHLVALAGVVVFVLFQMRLVQLVDLPHDLGQLVFPEAADAVQLVDVLEVPGIVFVHRLTLHVRGPGGAADLLDIVAYVAGGGKV